MIHDALSQHIPVETLGPPPCTNLSDLGEDDGDTDGLPRWTIPVPSLERIPSGEWARFFDHGADGLETTPPPPSHRDTDPPRPGRLDTLPCPPPDDASDDDVDQGWEP